MLDMALLRGLGQLVGSMGKAQSRACRDAVEEIERLQTIVDKLSKALPDPQLLRALADWLDGKQKGVLLFGVVQDDLRAMATTIDEAAESSKRESPLAPATRSEVSDDHG